MPRAAAGVEHPLSRDNGECQEMLIKPRAEQTFLLINTNNETHSVIDTAKQRLARLEINR